MGGGKREVGMIILLLSLLSPPVSASAAIWQFGGEK